MLKKLQRKFILIAMSSIAIVLIVLISTINLMNYQNVIRNADSLLIILSQHGGTFPTSRETIDKEKPYINETRPFFSRAEISAEAAYNTRFFTVTLDEEGELFAVNTGRIHAVSASTAVDYASTLFSEDKTTGFVGNYRYTRISLKSLPTEDLPSIYHNDHAQYMYIFLDCEQYLDTFRTFLLISIAISIASFIITLILIIIFSNRAIKPMAESYEKQKRFITDASHEIKTPLTIIDANTEILEMMEGTNEWTESIRNQIRRLTDLTEKMVFLTRMDEENISLLMLDFSLSDAISETVEPFSAVASTRQQQIITDIDPQISYHGNEDTIRQLVSILMDNAIKYASVPGEIRISLKNNGRNRVLTISNTVDEIETGNLDYLFDRFYRRDKSRSQKTKGHGIGLSVALAIVNSHKGKITAKSTDGKSIQFIIIL